MTQVSHSAWRAIGMSRGDRIVPAGESPHREAHNPTATSYVRMRRFSAKPLEGVKAPTSHLSGSFGSSPPPSPPPSFLSSSLSPSFPDVYPREDDLVLRLPDVKLLRVGRGHRGERLLDHPAPPPTQTHTSKTKGTIHSSSETIHSGQRRRTAGRLVANTCNR